MAHLKRLLAPRFWRVPKKEKKWVISPDPGPHRKFECIPLGIIVRDILHLADTRKEAKRIIKRGEILVDGRARKSIGYPVGLFDVLSIPRIKEHYRIVPTSYGLDLLKINPEEAKLKLCKIVKKTVVKKGRLQIGLNDGKTLLVDEDVYKTNDSLILTLPELSIVNHIPMKAGNLGVIVKGKNSGRICRIKEIIPGSFRRPSKAICEVDKEEKEVLLSRVFVIGKEKPLLTVS